MRDGEPPLRPTLSVCIGVLASMARSDAFTLIRDSDIDGVELLGDPDLYDADALLGDLAGYGLSVTALTAAARLPTGRDLSHPDPRVRSATVTHLRSCIAFAKLVGAPVVAVAPTAVGRHWAEADRAAELRWCAEGLRALAVDADRFGIQLGIEVLNRYATPTVTTVAAAHELADLAGGGPIGIIVDTFHSAIEERCLADAIRSAGRRLVNLQVADNTREGPGHGGLDFAAVARALEDIGYQGAISLEAFPAGCGAFPDVPPARLPEAVSYVREFRSFISALPFPSNLGDGCGPIPAP